MKTKELVKDVTMWQQKKSNKEKEAKILSNGMHGMLARLLSQRSVEIDNVEPFLNPDYKELSHPHKLHGVKDAAQIFYDIAKSKGSVAVIGDYDCDGIVSSTMLKELCNNFNLQCTVFLPSRLEHGYGLNPKTIASFSEKMTKVPDLLFITDCGMNSRDEVESLKSLGIKKIIIIDHHTGNSDKIANNADALVTWHLSNGFNEMCACGEVFQFIRGVRWLTKSINPVEFLTYAAIGTVADVSPVIGDNRIIVKNGLTKYAIDHVHGVGLHALLQQSKIDSSSITQDDIAFRIAPRINAVGRMYHPDIVYNLLTERDTLMAQKIAEHISIYNDERKEVQSNIEKSAHQMVEKNKFSNGILVINKDWHIGVVGIVASRLVETYNVPAIVVGYHNGIWKGSGRASNGVNILQVLNSCPEIFDGYGGHAGAVGVTLSEESIADAPRRFDEACKKYFNEQLGEIDTNKYFDAVLKPHAITKDIGDVIMNLYPFCKAYNPEPVFKVKDVEIIDVDLIEKDTWKLLKFRVVKDNFQVPYAFKTFTPKCNTEIAGRKANVIFTFPQKTEEPNNPFFKYELNVIDIELL